MPEVSAYKINKLLFNNKFSFLFEIRISFVKKKINTQASMLIIYLCFYLTKGEEGCLAGLTFVVTGVLESIERDDAKGLIEGHGGKLMTTLSKNTKYIVIGRDAGASKMDKVWQCFCSVITSF